MVLDEELTRFLRLICPIYIVVRSEFGLFKNKLGAERKISDFLLKVSSFGLFW